MSARFVVLSVSNVKLLQEACVARRMQSYSVCRVIDASGLTVDYDSNAKRPTQ
jgi:hypothetical protein